MQAAMLAQQAQQAADARLQAGQGWAVQTIDAAQPLQLSALEQGHNTARGDLNTAVESYQPYTEGGLKAWALMQDAAGLNGGGGHDRALAAFRTSPGYDWRVQ